MFRFRQLAVASMNKRISPKGTIAFYTPYEPKFLVRRDAKADPRMVKVPYLKDSVREEMYARHLSDPQEWTFDRLSQFYKSSLIRTKAVVLLMHKRFSIMKEKGFTVTIVNGNKPHVEVTIPDSWNGLYKAYEESEKKDVEAVLKSYNETCTDEKRANMSNEEAATVIENLKDHYRRVNNAVTHQERMDNILKRFAKAGVNVSFRETDSRTHHPGGKPSLRDIYHPQLFNDEDFERGKKNLLKRIEVETRGQVEHNLQFYHDKFASPAATGTSMKTAPDAPLSRWKLAFKDTSVGEHIPGRPTTPTTVRTRSGSIRKATPLEESAYSWNAAPMPLDIEINEAFEHFSKKYVTPFINPDKDDNVPQHIAKEKLEKRRVAVEASKAKK